ncbi:MAG TPA: aminopeptidase N C-terminal domain-containing protein, partial [Sphingomonadales bacterium]
VHSGHGDAEAALAAFYDKWKDEDLVIDKWFSIQATAPQPAVLDRLEELRQHPAFTLRNPNRLRALVGAFAQLNQVRFHDASGRGYAFLRRQVQELDTINPQVAARILAPLGRWQRHDPARQEMMRGELEVLLRLPNLSRDVYEVVTKSLGAL